MNRHHGEICSLFCYKVKDTNRRDLEVFRQSWIVLYYIPNTSPPGTSRRRSTPWSGALRRVTSFRLCLVLPVPVRHLPWQMSLQSSINPLWSLRTIRHWRHSSTASSRNFSRRMRWSILYPIMPKCNVKQYVAKCERS